MTTVELHHGGATDTGLVREHNEDAFLVAPPLFVVADGMGGHDHGDVASRIVIEEFRALDPTSYDARAAAEAVSATLHSARERIAEHTAAHSAQGYGRASAGTTVVAAVLVTEPEGHRWLIANLGDSRAYRVAGDRLEQVSVDHSLVQELLDAGRLSPEQVASHPDRHVITRALGGRSEDDPDFFVLPTSDARRLLLCTDGVTGMLDDATIARILGECEDPRDAADTVVAAAVSAGGDDNATAVVVDVVGLDDDTPYDSDAQRLSLEQKLGTLP